VSVYRLSTLAHRDIDSIWDHLADHGGVVSAERFIWRLYDLFGLLGHNPSMGRLSRVAARGVRKFPLDDYIICYVTQDRRVLIARILHGKHRQRKAYQAPS